MSFFTAFQFLRVLGWNALKRHHLDLIIKFIFLSYNPVSSFYNLW